MRPYLIPTLIGALVAFVVRFLAGSGLTNAIIGAIVVLAIVAALVLTGRWLGWRSSPMLYAGVAAVASTVAFLLTRAPQ